MADYVQHWTRSSLDLKNWEQPDDLPRAKQLLGKMRGAKTKALRKDDAFPVDKINSVI